MKEGMKAKEMPLSGQHWDYCGCGYSVRLAKEDRQVSLRELCIAGEKDCCRLPELKLTFAVDQMQVCQKEDNGMEASLYTGGSLMGRITLTEEGICLYLEKEQGRMNCLEDREQGLLISLEEKEQRMPTSLEKKADAALYVHAHGFTMSTEKERYYLPVDGKLKAGAEQCEILPIHGKIRLVAGRKPFAGAKWIWRDGEIRCNSVCGFRKSFQVSRPVALAVVRTSAHNHLKLDLNGQRISGYVTPAPSNPQKGKLYLTYDVTGILRNGINDFLATVLYFGGGGQNYENGLPGFILEMDILYEDGTGEILVTDESWQVLAETPYENQTPYQQNRRVTPMEIYHADREALLYEEGQRAVLAAANEAGWRLIPQEIPEGGIRERLIPALVGVQEVGVQVFDAGKILSGWPILHLQGFPGVKIQVRYSEDMLDGRVKHNVANESSENYGDCYIMRGDPEEHWAPDFSYKAFRYMEITGYPRLIEPRELEVVSAGTMAERSGAFCCSNELLNDIYDACIQTQKNNMLGQLVDCPHREQAQYLGDSDVQAETLMYHFYEPGLPRKVLQDFMCGQLENGRYPFVYPSNFDNPEFRILIPEYDFRFVTLLRKIYRMYGDREILWAGYESAVKMLDYYWQIRNQETGLLKKGIGFPEDWNISDWPYPTVDESGEFLMVENSLFYRNLVIMQEVAQLLGKGEDAESFGRKAALMKNCILEHLYDPEKKRFADGKGASHAHQGVNALAFLYGLVPEEDRQACLTFIEEEGFGSSSLLMNEVLRVLMENGREQAAYKLLCRTEQPSWGYMIEQGFQTMWEGFQDKESHSHAWNAYPARILSELLLGIRALEPGFAQVLISPYIPEDMSYAEGKIKTVRGDIRVLWEKRDGELRLECEIPAGVAVRIRCQGQCVEKEPELERKIWQLTYGL